MIIDFHTHIYPDAIAGKAVDSIGSFYSLPMHMDGTLRGLIRAMDAAGVDKSVVCSAAVAADRVRAINRFIVSAVQACPDRLQGYGTLHPDMDDVDGEIRFILENGLKGIKLHPDMQRFSLSERRTQKLFDACEGVLPMLIHTGDKRFGYSNPSLIPPVLKTHPRLQLICAHLGGYSEWDAVARILADTNVFVDCSSSFYALSRERARELICLFGQDRVLFGSDYPMWNMKDELIILRSLALPSDMMEKILHRNAEKLLGI